MKIRFGFVVVSSVIWLLILSASAVWMRSQQANALGSYILDLEIVESSPGIDVMATYDNMRKYLPWDRDFDKMIVYKKDE